MGIAAVENIRLTAVRSCNCYKVESLTKTILDTTQISNLRDRYVLGGKLGWGQFGVIRVCSDKLTGDFLACKSIAKDRLVTLDDFCSIKLEIEIMTKLAGHPNIVDLKAVYEDEDSVHLVMELCAGGELFHRLEKYGRFRESEARHLFKQLMEVVKYCHENGIVHRDLKPENILLATKSSSSPIKLADFGLATYVKRGENLHGTVGSPFYIAPEVLTGGYDEAADVWSAGVILYILLSGTPPFGGKTKSKIFDAVRAAELRFPVHPWDHISLSARDLIIGMLCVDPSKRLSAAQVLHHPWVENCRELAQEAYRHNSHARGELEVGGRPSSTPFINRNQDYSFSDGSLVVSFNGKSSFSFMLENGSPCFESQGFSFTSCCQSSAAELFSSPVPSMPSFTFFSPLPSVEPRNDSVENKAGTSKMSGGHGVQQKTELGKGGLLNGSRIRSKRNHTIGFGELDHFDLVLTESVIRWASCTRIPTAPSLREQTESLSVVPILSDIFKVTPMAMTMSSSLDPCCSVKGFENIMYDSFPGRADETRNLVVGEMMKEFENGSCRRPMYLKRLQEGLVVIAAPKTHSTNECGHSFKHQHSIHTDECGHSLTLQFIKQQEIMVNSGVQGHRSILF